MSLEESAPHAENYPLNALISHAFGYVASPTQYSDEKRLNLDLEQRKRATESEKPRFSNDQLVVANSSPGFVDSPCSDTLGAEESGSLRHFYDSRPLTAYNYSAKMTQSSSRPKKSFSPSDDSTSTQLDPQNSKELEDLANFMFQGLEQKLNATQAQIDEKFSTYENQLENIQKQIENLAYDSGLVDLYDASSSP